MAINFPTSPSTGQLYTFGETTWQWSGEYWNVYSAQTGYITSVSSAGGGYPVIQSVTSNALTLKSFSGTNLTITDNGGQLNFYVPPDRYVNSFTYTPSANTITLGQTESYPSQTVVINRFSGLTIDSGLTASVISATTYQNLPTSATTFVTGFTYSANTFTIRDNSGSTFNASINTVTGLTVNGNLSVTGTTSTGTISATTYQNLPTSATTFVTGFTYSSNTFTIRDNSGSTFNATINTVTGLTVNGNLSVTGTTSTNILSATTYQNLPSQLSTKSFGIVIDGGGSSITTGIKGDLVIPYNMTISSWTILADTTGSTVVDIWKSTYANFPSTSGNTIVTGGTKPNISNGIRNQSVSLTGWNPTINSGDILRFNVDSVSTITRITLSLNGIITS